MGLNDSFGGVRSQILLMDHLPTLNRVFSILLQQERQHQHEVVNDSKVFANAVENKKSFGRGRGSNFKNGGRGNGKMCTYCGKSGHTVETCYKKHGYPPSFGNNSSYVNNFVMDDNEGSTDNHSMKDHDESRSMTFSKDPSGINHYVLSTTTQNLHKSWILDTGATDHICSSLHWFTTYTRIDPIPVRLPNGSSVMANFSGTIKLTKSLKIDHVLFIPQFTFNLVSVSKLTANLGCTLIFESKSCIIQERKLKMISLAEEFEGLYYLKVDQGCSITTNSIVAVHSLVASTLPNSILWHLRLGHLSYDRMTILHKQYDLFQCLNMLLVTFVTHHGRKDSLQHF
uniref:Uncharacterized protein n=1 Tax=Cajanus cajan TaxID=3821 RepID=A0A151TIU7_CAJCA|nr:hypothetical protein KK1_013301 [Cajanus cajan]